MLRVLLSEKKQIHGRPGCPKLGEADPGGLGASPQEINHCCTLLFQEKEAKSVVLLRRRFGHPNLGDADPGVWGLAPRK
jgi:hypothetical protein